MRNGFFAVTISGEDTLTNDLNNFLLELRDPIKTGLSSVADGFTHSLDKHIEGDVYDAYQPKRYPRRAFNESLMSPKYKHISVHDLSLSFQYEPMGFHRGKMKDMMGAEWDPNIHKWVVMDRATDSIISEIENPEDPIKPKPVHGDALIQRIQTGRGYDWKPPKKIDTFPERPFWDNFVDEQRSGAALNSFVYGFNSGVHKLELEGGNLDIEWNSNDGSIEMGSVCEDDDYELPW